MKIEWRETAGCDNGCYRHPHCLNCGRDLGCDENDPVIYERRGAEADYDDSLFCAKCGGPIDPR